VTSHWTKTDTYVVLGLVVIAAIFRLWRLDELPPGFQFDEAYNASDALRVLGGERPLFFEANGGREALHIYWLAPFVGTLGPTALAVRLASAMIGIATVGLSYPLWRRLLPAGERLAAFLASLLLAMLYWHVHFSRYGIRAILLPLLLIPVVYFLWSAAQPGERREWVMARAARNLRAVAGPAFVSLVLCGLFVGLSLYAHPAGRFVPVLVAAWFAWLFVGGQVGQSALRHFSPLDSGHAAGAIMRDLAIVAASAFVVFIPLGGYFLQHPQAFFGHPTVVAITDQRVGGGNLSSALSANALRIGGMFFLVGDEAWIHNLSGRPVFDLGIALFFIVGLGVWARKLRVRDPLAVLLLIWLPLMLLPSLLSDAAPNFSRAIGALPALCLVPAWGLSSTVVLLRRRLQRFRFAPLALGTGLALILLASAWTTLDDYFVTFPAFPETYYTYDVDKIAASQRLLADAASNRVFVPPLLAQHETFALLTRAAGFKSFDNGEIFVLPAADPRRGMTYAFPVVADPPYLAEFERTYGALVEKFTVSDALGKPLLFEYRIAPLAIPATADALPVSLPVAPQRVVNANFGGLIHFAGYRIEPPVDGDHPYHLTLVWQALQPIPRDYTLFIHLSDATGRGISQRDRRPGNGSYPTTAWSPGDIVAETYEVWPKNTGGALQFAVGWYQSPDGMRLPVVDAAGKPAGEQVVFAAESTR
jgi:hypothetical protein